jgi:hypothetical protein
VVLKLDHHCKELEVGVVDVTYRGLWYPPIFIINFFPMILSHAATIIVWLTLFLPRRKYAHDVEQEHIEHDLGQNPKWKSLQSLSAVPPCTME